MKTAINELQSQQKWNVEDPTDPMCYAMHELQNRLDECIRHDLGDLKDNLLLKLQHLNEKQAEFFLLLELSSNTYIEQELAQLRKYEAIKSLYPYVLYDTDYIDDTNFCWVWDSSFLECLSIDERRKYLDFDFSNFDKHKYVTQNNFYDDSLPYFSQIVQFIAFSCYINTIQDYLKHDQEEGARGKKKMISSNEKPKTFESNFNEQQIRKLTDCINEAYIFTHFITTTTTTQIFNCELDTPLRISNNRLLAYFFMALKNKNLITKNWQSVCYLNQLFLSSGDGHAIKQNDLSTAANESRDLSPKDSAIIDKYVNKL